MDQKNQEAFWQIARRFWRHIAPKRRSQLGILVLLMVLSSFAEVVSIGAVLPFLGALTAPEKVFVHPMAQPLIVLGAFKSPDSLLLPLTLIFSVAAIVSGLLRLLLLWTTTRLSFGLGADLSFSIYRRTLYQPYAVHVARNSSEVVDGVVNKANTIIFGFVGPTLTLLTSALLMLFVMVALFTLQPVVALIASLSFGAIYLLIIRLTQQRLHANSKRVARESTQVIKALNEGLGGIRDVLIDGAQPLYCQVYRDADLPLRKAQGNNQFIAGSPRYLIEAFGMVLIAFLAYGLAQQPQGLGTAIPVLAALALGAQRLLPALQQAYSAWTSFVGNQAALQDALELLDQPMPEHVNSPAQAALPFRSMIEFRQLGFRYAAHLPWVLRNVSLQIPKGSRIGFIGTSGSGKSTLLDIVMGLLSPSQGCMIVDGQMITKDNCRAWQAHLAHVPQAIYLIDSSIEANIAFGVPSEQIDQARVESAARQAQIADLIESLPDRYQTLVGERGVRLSGGQRQRIGIARALYKQADVIVFDEATSALDNETEQAVMQAIEGLSSELTILIIAHRLSTLSNCTHVVELAEGGIKRVGSYREIMIKVE